MNPIQGNRNKNPLLSCAVTGGFDEFTGSGIVLTAAEKPVFTIGTPAISDTDNFSDVSLDRDGTSDTASSQLEGPAFVSPLAEFDTMGNLGNANSAPTLDLSQDQQLDTNLNPISAAFAQLPNAASTVFSTFSNIIKGSTSQPRLDEQQPHGSTIMESIQEPVNPNSFMLASNFDPAAPPPVFFSPADESMFKKQSVEPPSSNTFRLGGHKKKTYAHIPGLSTNQPPTIQQSFNATSVMPPLPTQTAPNIEPVNHYPEFQAPQPDMNIYGSQQREPEKSNKFSLTSLLPSQLLEKIPSTINLFGTPEPVQQPQQPYVQQFAYHEDFSVMTSTFDQRPQATNYFNAPPQSAMPFVGVNEPNTPQNLNQAAPPVNFFTPQQFNTSPFASAVDPTPIASVPAPLGPPPSTFSPQIYNQTAFSPAPFSKVTNNEPPKIDAISAETNCAPPTFFNPVEATQMFQPSPNDHGKAKNPYSSSRISRGVGMYKTRTASEKSMQTPTVPPMPEPAIQVSSFVPNLMDQNTPPRPPSIPSMQPMNYGNSQVNANVVPTFHSAQPPVSSPQNFFVEQPQTIQEPVQIFQETAAVPIRKKSDLNIPECAPSQFNFFTPAPTQVDGQNFCQLPPAVQSIEKPFVPEVQSTSFFETVSPAVSMFNPPTPAQCESFLKPSETITNLPEVTAVEYQTTFFQPKAPQSTPANFFQQPSAPSESIIGSEAGSKEVSNAANLFQPYQTSTHTANSESSFKSDNFSELTNASSSTLNFFQPSIASEADTRSNSSAAPSVGTYQRQSSILDNGNGTHVGSPTTTSFFTNESVYSPIELSDTSSFNSSVFNSTVQAPNNDTLADIADKLDSLSTMSGNVGSTLSLFATSELDASAAQKSFNFLDTQLAEPARTTSSPQSQKPFRAVYRHWFYQSLYWHPFAMTDSLALDDALTSGQEIVVTDGGRFEVNLRDKRRSSIYWSSGTNAIRRCSWFFKNPQGSEQNLIPFDESTAEFMESEYEKAVLNNTWNHRLQMPNSNDYVIFRDAAVIEYHEMGQNLTVKRGVDEFVIDDGEEGAIDHLIIAVSNFGDKIDDSADELRSKCFETMHHYYSEAFDCGQIGRLEVLPISLNSINVLQIKETNATIEGATGGNPELLMSSTFHDVIMKTAFYCSDEYYQNIMNHLAFSLKEIVSKFLHRNADYKGKISLIATSFEALFLFDLLLNQVEGPDFWKLSFSVSNFYAFGMPSNLLTIRNREKLHSNFELKACEKFLNVVHRLDPIAQRIEPLIKPDFTQLPPESIENVAANRIDFTIADGSSLESFSVKNYFTSELIILRITNEIYGSLKMDSGSL